MAPFALNKVKKAKINVNLLSQFIMQQIEQSEPAKDTLAKY